MARKKPASKSQRSRRKKPPGAASTRAKQAPRTIAVDFDGVIADYDGWKGAGVLGPPRRDVREALRVLHAEGWKIIIHTTRGETEISAYLVEHGIPHHEINRNSDYRTLGTKPVADVYWDDRAFRYSGDAGRDVELIRRFRTWSGRE